LLESPRLIPEFKGFGQNETKTVLFFHRSEYFNLFSSLPACMTHRSAGVGYMMHPGHQLPIDDKDAEN
jgi:hypothetical protein